MSTNPRIVPFYPNAKFLRNIFADQWPRALICGFSGDPDNLNDADWTARPAAKLPGAVVQHDLNLYFCPSLVSGTRRTVEAFESLHVIVLDDVGTKIDRDKAEAVMGEFPHYVIETSPGNYQLGWLTEPLTDLAWVKGLLSHLRNIFGAGDNLSDPVPWRRLPTGINGKAKYRGPDGKPWRCTVSWSPYPRLIASEIENRLGAIAPKVFRQAISGKMPDPAEIETDPVLQVFRQLGMVLGTIRDSSMGWGFDVECPWSQDHSSRIQEGALYVPLIEAFNCFHGHCNDRRKPSDVRARLDELLREDSGGVDCLAKHEFDDIELVIPRPGLVPGPGDQTAVGRSLTSYEATEDGLALAFAAEHAEQLRFDHLRKKWFRWTGTFWRQDETDHAYRWVRKLLRRYRAGSQDLTPAQARAWGKMAVASAIDRGARADGRLAVSGLSWDQDNFMAGAPGCEIELTTGEVKPPNPAHKITKQLLVAPDKTMKTPLWDQFLWDSTGGDPEMIDFLQAWSGYNLTGDTSEEKFVFIYGPGGNGKGTYIYTTSAILNDYAGRCAADMFMVRKFQPHSEEVARLAGVRAVTASEIEEGRTFNAVRLKDFTGRDGKQTGAFKYKDTFEFLPQFKITFVGNSQPRLSVDDAMRRRIILVPFVLKPKVVDLTLKDRLRDEYPGILVWMIEGENRRRKMGGLAALIPAAAISATRAYLDDQDTIKVWVAERCVSGPNEGVGVSIALEDYKMWCSSQNRNPEAGQNNFSAKVIERFPRCKVEKRNSSNVLIGITLNTTDC